MERNLKLTPEMLIRSRFPSRHKARQNLRKLKHRLLANQLRLTFPIPSLLLPNNGKHEKTPITIIQGDQEKIVEG